ncbi:MAG TPA: hypothetical protein VKB19_20565 [Pedobacter sp.]|nr:hypothetical protein [Pedobacter sp.]
MEEQKDRPEGLGQELPPFVKTWRQFYRLLIGWLVFLILMFYAFTQYFR